MSPRYKEVCYELLKYITDELGKMTDLNVYHVYVAGGSVVGEVYNKPYNDVDVFMSVNNFDMTRDHNFEKFFDKLCNVTNIANSKVTEMSFINGDYGLTSIAAIRKIVNFPYKGFNVQVILCNDAFPYRVFDLSICRIALQLNWQRKKMVLLRTSEFKDCMRKKKIYMYDTAASVDHSLKRMYKYLQRFTDFTPKFEDELYDREGTEDKITDFINSLEFEKIVLNGR